MIHEPKKGVMQDGKLQAKGFEFEAYRLDEHERTDWGKQAIIAHRN